MNQSEENDASIHCETGAGRQYRNPQLMSCADAFENILKVHFQSSATGEQKYEGSMGLHLDLLVVSHASMTPFSVKFL